MSQITNNQELIETLIVFGKTIIVWFILWAYLYIRAIIAFEKEYKTKDKTGWQWKQFTKHRTHGATLSGYVSMSYKLLKIAILAILVIIVISYQV